MERKIDARIIKTKAKLVTTFLKLIEERSFENITVNDICVAADIRRATFYKHYNDKYDFFKFIVSTLRSEFDAEWARSGKAGSIEYFSEYAISLVDFFEQHDTMIKKICASNASYAMFQIAAIQNFEDTKQHLEHKAEDGKEFRVSLDTVSAMLVGGVMQTLIQWVMKDKPISSEQLKHEIKLIIDNIQKYN